MCVSEHHPPSPLGRTDPDGQLRTASDAPGEAASAARSATSHIELVGEILWESHRFSAVVNRAIGLIGQEQFTTNNDLVTLVELYLKRRLRPRHLVPLLDLTRGGVTNLLDRLEELGVIRRSRSSDDDLRGVDIVLTPEGRAIAERIASAFAFAVDVSEQQLTLLSRLSRDAGIDGGDYAPIRYKKPRAALKGLLGLAAAVPQIWGGYRVGFGSDEPRPGRIFEILHMAARPGGTRPGDIVEATLLSPSSTTELVDRLEQCGWVGRSRSDADGRIVVVSILPAGRAGLETAIVHAEPHIGGFVGGLFPC